MVKPHTEIFRVYLSAAATKDERGFRAAQENGLDISQLHFEAQLGENPQD
jgi:hypothetical protein